MVVEQPAPAERRASDERRGRRVGRVVEDAVLVVAVGEVQALPHRAELERRTAPALAQKVQPARTEVVAMSPTSYPQLPSSASVTLLQIEASAPTPHLA